MSITSKINEWLEAIGKEEDLFPYLLNRQTGAFDREKDRIYYGGPYWDENEVGAAIKSLLMSKWISAGQSVTQFEAAFSKQTKTTRSVMVNSGSSANLVAISAMKTHFGWDEDSEIIVSVVGFPTTLAPIIQCGLKPVFVDIDWTDLNLSLEEVQRKITKNTKALFLSPALGNPPNMERVEEIVKEAGIHLMLDGCDSLGSEWKGRLLTEFATISTCSFYPAHHISTGEGGMVSCNDDKLHKIARSFANWGRDCYCEGIGNLLQNGTCKKRFDHWLPGVDKPVDHKYLYTHIGYNLKPLDLQGAIGLEQLKKLSEIIQLRRSNKETIGRAFEGSIKGVRVVKETPGAKTSWFGVPVICEEASFQTELVAYLEANRIQTRTFFGGNILAHPGYAHLGNRDDYPSANRVLNQVLFIGCSPTLSPEMLEYQVDVLKAFHQREKKAS